MKRKKWLPDPNHPICCYPGCDRKVHVMRVISNDNSKKPIEVPSAYRVFRAVCKMHHEYNWNEKMKRRIDGVGLKTIKLLKKDYCENYDGHLGFKCCTKHDKSKINMMQETGVLESRKLDLDHKDGDHFNNDPSNIQTLCKSCHATKTHINGDSKYRGKNQFVGQKKKENFNCHPLGPNGTKPLKHINPSFFFKTTKEEK
tara:strand:- start:4078 stop:4677 length:600 start_codon:yes stop_codon:yes gene_type:complete